MAQIDGLARNGELSPALCKRKGEMVWSLRTKTWYRAQEQSPRQHNNLSETWCSEYRHSRKCVDYQ